MRRPPAPFRDRNVLAPRVGLGRNSASAGIGHSQKASAAYSPPPEGFVSPVTWGVESHVRGRFEAAGIAHDDLTVARDTFVLDFEGSPAQFVAELSDCTGRR